MNRTSAPVAGLCEAELSAIVAPPTEIIRLEKNKGRLRNVFPALRMCRNNAAQANGMEIKRMSRTVMPKNISAPGSIMVNSFGKSLVIGISEYTRLGLTAH